MVQLERTDLVERITLASTVALAVAAVPGPGRDAWPVVAPLALAVAGVVVTRRPTFLTLAALAVAPVSLAFPRHAAFAHLLAGALLGLVTLALARRVDASRSTSTHPRLRALAAGAVSAAAFFAGALVLDLLRRGSVVVDAIPAELARALVGGATGCLLGLVASFAFLRRAGDDVHAALAKLQVVRSEVLRSLVQDLADARGRVLRALEPLPADDVVRREARRAADAVALAGIRLVDRFAVADRVLASTPVTVLESNLADLERRLADAADAGVQRDLARARDVTAEQLAQLRTLSTARERLAARLQAEVAALRRNETSLALLASADAAVAALELEAIGSGLSRRAADLAAEGAELHAAVAAPAVRAVVARA